MATRRGQCGSVVFRMVADGVLYSWGIAYNLYADQLLGTNLVPSSVYDMRACYCFYLSCPPTDSPMPFPETQWYTSVLSTLIRRLLMTRRVLIMCRLIRRASGHSVSLPLLSLLCQLSNSIILHQQHIHSEQYVLCPICGLVMKAHSECRLAGIRSGTDDDDDGADANH